MSNIMSYILTVENYCFKMHEPFFPGKYTHAHNRDSANFLILHLYSYMDRRYHLTQRPVETLKFQHTLLLFMNMHVERKMEKWQVSWGKHLHAKSNKSLSWKESRSSCTCLTKISQKSGPTIAVSQLCMCNTSGCFPDFAI